jgi:hypothetical protein
MTPSGASEVRSGPSSRDQSIWVQPDAELRSGEKRPRTGGESPDEETRLYDWNINGNSVPASASRQTLWLPSALWQIDSPGVRMKPLDVKKLDI